MNIGKRRKGEKYHFGWVGRRGICFWNDRYTSDLHIKKIRILEPVLRSGSETYWKAISRSGTSTCSFGSTHWFGLRQTHKFQPHKISEVPLVPLFAFLFSGPSWLTYTVSGETSWCRSAGWWRACWWRTPAWLPGWTGWWASWGDIRPTRSSCPGPAGCSAWPPARRRSSVEMWVIHYVPTMQFYMHRHGKKNSFLHNNI